MTRTALKALQKCSREDRRTAAYLLAGPGKGHRDPAGNGTRLAVHLPVFLTVISWLFDERPNLLADRYRDLIGAAGCCWPSTRCCELPLL